MHVKNFDENNSMELEGDWQVGYVLREFRDGELYTETEYDSRDEAMDGAHQINKEWERRSERSRKHKEH